MIEKIKKNINILITTIFVLICLLLYVKFPATGFFQYKVSALSFLVIIPYLYCRFILKTETFFKKFTIGDWKKNLYWTIGGVTIAFLLAVIIFNTSDLLRHYPLSQAIRKNFWEFLKYELFGVMLTVALYEVFFRGFVMFYFEKYFGIWSILIQALFFYLMLFVLGIPFYFCFWYVIFIPIAGIIAYKSNSLLYSFLGQIIFIIIVDAIAIALMAK